MKFSKMLLVSKIIPKADRHFFSDSEMLMCFCNIVYTSGKISHFNSQLSTALIILVTITFDPENKHLILLADSKILELSKVNVTLCRQHFWKARSSVGKEEILVARKFLPFSIVLKSQ